MILGIFFKKIIKNEYNKPTDDGYIAFERQAGKFNSRALA